jgi:hypothetical protein
MDAARGQELVERYGDPYGAERRLEIDAEHCHERADRSRRAPGPARRVRCV